MKYVLKTEKLHWTNHVRGKMYYYGLSEGRLKKVLRNPDRKELGIAPRTVAVMQKAGTRKHPSEIWLMYQKRGRALRIITAWRYPGASPKRQPPPIPEDILWALKENEDIPEEYLRGETQFLGCRIDLSKGVFIPREETEFWVKKALKAMKGKNLFVLDLFAGSGCIGIGVLKHIRGCSVDFADVDGKAVVQIRINLKLNAIPKSRYSVHKSDIFRGLKKKKYDYIFANPPYAAQSRIGEVQDSVLKYEPRKAILSGEKGMDSIEKFLKQARKFLKDKGVIYLEYDPLQKKDIEGVLRKENYSSFKFFRDQFRKYRFARIRK